MVFTETLKFEWQCSQYLELNLTCVIENRVNNLEIDSPSPLECNFLDAEILYKNCHFFLICLLEQNLNKFLQEWSCQVT